MTDQGPRGFVQPSLRPTRRLLPGTLPSAQPPSAPPAPPPEQASPPGGPPTASFAPLPATPEPRATGPLGSAPDAPPPVNAPYGMRPGQRHLLPGISDRAGPMPPPVALDLNAPVQITMPDGSRIPLTSRNPRDSDIVDKLGQSLFNQSGNDAEKRVASAVTEWGQSMVGQMPIQDIQKVMADRWDHGVGNVVKRDLQHERFLTAQANRGAGAAGKTLQVDEDGVPVPTSAFGHKVMTDWSAEVRNTINSEQSKEAYKALSQHENESDVILAEILSPNAMDQRGALMSRMLQLSGKAATDMERAQLYAAAGKWTEFKNNLSMWLAGIGKNPDAQMDQGFRNQFAEMMRNDKATIAQTKRDIGRQAATRFKQVASRIYGPLLAQEGADAVYQSFTGVGREGSYEPPPDASSKKVLPTYVAPSRAAPAKPRPAAPAKAAPAPAKAPTKDANSHLD